MKVFILFIASMILVTTLHAASIQGPIPPPGKYRPTAVYLLSAKQLEQQYGIRMNWRQKLVWPLQRRLLKKAEGELTAKQRSAKTLGLVSGIGGLLGIALVFVVPFLGVALGVVAFVTGILSNKENPKRIWSIIGIVSGSLLILFGILAVIAIAAWLSVW